MDRLPTSSVRGNFADILNQVEHDRRRVVLHRYGKNIAAIVPIEDYEMLQGMELEIGEARSEPDGDQAFRSPSGSGHAKIWERLGAELGL
jgi:prevent-host-death family protein